jgi:hypothetical protein
MGDIMAMMRVGIVIRAKVKISDELKRRDSK